MHARQRNRLGFFLQSLLAALLATMATADPVLAQAQKCDANGDGQINLTDINLIIAARNTPATGPSDPRDPDGNLVINALDARTCQQRCTLAGCALPPANTPPVANNDGYATAEDTTLVVMAPGVLGNDTDAQGNALTATLVSGPATGTLVLSANGSFSYMPAPNASGPVSFTYRASDGALASNVATVTIDVTPVDDGPVAAADSYTTPEDTPLTVAAPGVLGNDGDVDSGVLTALLVSGPAASAGTLTLNGDGSFTFIPAANFTGAATFSYVASDGPLQSGVTTVTIDVTSADDAPVANADMYGTDEDVPLTVAAPGVLANDTDPDSVGLTAVLNVPPASGTLVLNADGSFTYTPAPNASGPASFSYRASDGFLTSGPATVSLTVLPVNDAPVATGDSYSTPANTPLSVAAPGVLANDTDQEGGGLAAVPGTGPSHGQLVLSANGAFTYTPDAGFSGADSFTYRASDGSNNSNEATVSITVTAATNTAPVANGDSYSTPEDTPLTVAAPGVLGNDSDAQSDPMTAALVSAPASGALVLDANGSFTYTPAANFAGTVSFTYRANDGALDSNVATVTIDVTPVNDLPVAVGDSYSTPFGTQLIVAAPGVLANDSDAEGSALTAALGTGPAHGQLVLNANGAFTYTPDAGFSGADSFTYRASDGSNNSNEATVSITVTAATNTAPVANGDSYSTPEDTPLTVAAPGVLGNDSDAQGDPMTAALVSSPASGALVLNANGSFTYTPVANFAGTVSFTYRANDGALDSNVATVTIDVTAVNDAPVAGDDSYTTPEDTPLTVAANGVLVNDTDDDGDPLTAIQVSGPAQGNLTLNADGSFTYLPPPQFNGSVSFTYRANDGTDNSNVATVTIDVTAQNDAPVANPDTYAALEDTTLTVVAANGVLGNDTDPESDTLTAQLVSGPASGSLNLSPDGGFTYTPAANFNGAVTFSYRASDAQTDSNVTTVTIDVTPANDVPVANADGYSTSEDVVLTVAAPGVLANDLDVEGSGLTASLVSPPATGSLTLNPDGSFTYTPQLNASGPVSFTYVASDSSLQSTPATVTITVLPINDAPVAGNDNYSTDIGTTLNVAAPGVLANDADQEGNGLTAAIESSPANGTLAFNADGSFSYTPNAGFSGSDTFTYRANDGTNLSNVGTVTIAVSGGTMTLSVQDSFIAVGGSTVGTVTLSSPSVGGTLVSLSNPSPATIFIPFSPMVPDGQTTATFTVQGLAIGTATIGATAPGYADASVTVTVTSNVITVGNVTVAPGAQAQFPVTLSSPAPAGGLTVNLTTLASSIATVPASVFIPAGQTIANPNPQVSGVGIGATTIRGTAANWAPGAGIATVAIAGSFSPNPIKVTQGQTAQTTLTLAQPAPAGGITVDLVTGNAAIATVGTPVAIPAGQISAVVTVTGVSASIGAGNTTLTASGTGLVSTAASIDVDAAPAISMGGATIGKDLQRAVSINLGAPAPAGNLVVTLTSSDPSKLLLSATPTAGGSASVTLTIGAGNSNATFYAQALVNTGTADVVATAPGYSTGNATMSFAPSGFRFDTIDFAVGIGDANKDLRICPVLLDAGNVYQTSLQLRGGLTVNVGVTSSNTAVGTIVGSPFAFTGGNECQNTVQFDPVAAGTSTLSLVQPAGFNTPTTRQSLVATVQANIANNARTVGKDLQVQASVSLGSPAPAGNLVVTIASADPAKVLVAPNATTAGAASTTISIAAGSSTGVYYLQALAAAGTVAVDLSAPGFASGATTVTLAPSGFVIFAPPGNFFTDTLDPNTDLRVCAAELNPTTLTYAEAGTLRFGITPVSVAMTSSNTAVGTIVGSPQSITGNAGCTPISGALQFDPVGAGTSTLAMGATPPGFSTPSNRQSIVTTVTASGITLPARTVGKDLQLTASGALQSPAPAGGTTVTLTSADPARLLLAPNATTAGAASIVVNVAQNVIGFNFTLQALDNTGTVQVTASAPGYANGAGTVTLAPSGFVISSPGNFSTNTLDPNTNLLVCAAELYPTTLTYAGRGTLRFGIAPVSVAMTSSATTVGTIVGSPQTIAGDTSCTPSSGALQFDPVGAGTSTLAMGATPAGFSTPSNYQSIVATVSASGITLPTRTVGKDLQLAASGSLQSPAPAGGTTVTLTSADPARLLLAPNATTAGAASIVVNVAQNASGFNFTLQALDSAGTVQVTASAPGYANGAGTVTLAPSGFVILQPSSNFSTNTLDANTILRVCAAELNPTTLNYAGQGTLRFGIAPVSVAMTSSNTAAGTIVGSPQTIAGNTDCTPTSGALQFDPVGAGTSTLAMGATPPGFSTPSNRQSIVATVTASGITVPAQTVGKDLQLGASGSLQSPAPVGGTTVTLTSSDPARVLLAPNATTAGAASIAVNVAQNVSGFSFTLQALDGTGTVQVTASAPGYVDGAGTVTLGPSGFVISSPSSISTTAAGANVNLRLCAALLNPTTLNYAGQGTLRFGLAPVSVGATSSNAAVGVIVNSPGAVSGSPSCTATGASGVNFDPVGAGTTTVSITPPAGFSVPSNFQQITATVN